jgi:hypothetical protein
MKLENQVVSLENAKKLAELGVTAESYFFHAEMHYNGYPPSGYGVYCNLCVDDLTTFVNKAPAYTVAELLDMLQKWRDSSMCELPLSDIDADYLAKFLIELIESNRVDVAQLNEGE